MSLVGGVVRDGLLGTPLGDDVDLVVEGDVAAVAGRVAQRLGARLSLHERFRTASVHFDDGTHLDFVGARRESYPRPGALPEVEPGTLDDDLRRRDFTVNAMALRLVGPDAGTLVDPLGGCADLERRLIRNLRPDAFEEDPSRIVRAARQAARLRFALENGTRRAAETHAPRLDWGNARVAEELRRLFGERDPAPAVELLRELGARGLAAEDPPGTAASLDEVMARDGVPVVERWPLLMGRFASEALLRRVALPGWAVEQARASTAADYLVTDLQRMDSPSAADRRLGLAPLAAAIVAAARGAPWAGDWLVRDRLRELEIDGSALIDAGVPQGPAIGRGLDAARAAMLDGQAETRDAQLRVALGAASE